MTSNFLRFSVVVSLLFLVGCGTQGDKTIAKVNGKKITTNELQFFIQELSKAGRPVDEQMKKKIVDQLIIKALLMEEAERVGITKDLVITKRIERERARIILDELTRREIDMFIMVTDDDLKQYYDQQKAKNPKGIPPFDQVKDRIRGQILGQKKMTAFNNLVNSLRTKAKITIDDKALKSIHTTAPATQQAPKP